jgi:glycine dehydrogenase
MTTATRSAATTASAAGAAHSTPLQQRESVLDFADGFIDRHIGPSADEVAEMLNVVGFESLDALTDAAVPADIRMGGELNIPAPRGEAELLAELKTLAAKNKVFRSCIGLGYHGTVTPPVILRNVLENPGWYTQYTPYQAEIAQGRLEALLNFQTMIADLTGLPLAGASLLDEGTAAAEAMGMCVSIARHKKMRFVADEACHPQTIGVLETRAKGLGVDLVVADLTADASAINDDTCGVLVQYPTTDGDVRDYSTLAETVHAHGGLFVAAADPLSLTVLTPPAEWGADVAVGSVQRFGVPMGLGGPHAAYIATHDKHARKLPGRLIGVSKDTQGNHALRMAIQTREQHIKRDKATSNICTAQALLAIIAGFYGVYHGPEGLTRIAERTRAYTLALLKGLEDLGHTRVGDGPVFDTLRIKLGRGRQHHGARHVHDAARERGINLREYRDGTVGVTLDETADRKLIADVLAAFNFARDTSFDIDNLLSRAQADALGALGSFERTSLFMTHPVFNTCRSETEMLRYIFKLQGRDLSLAHAMIPLGSCTMKLNASSEMLPVTWDTFANLHPFAPDTQWRGYTQLFRELEHWLSEITGFPALCLQPNAGAQGEYTGLMVIKAFHEHNGDHDRDVCIIPTSAHGTNPASAVMAGMRVVAVKCDDLGNIDVDDLKAKADQHKDNLAALMITYPSTHGVFESTIREVCQVIHDRGGQVYMDGANMNAQVGLTTPADCGADVCHLNLHKTFCIPHGGGGPGMGPIGVAEHLAPFLPGHPVERPDTAGEHSIGPVAAAPYGSALILTISYVYIALMGADGLTKATQVAILNANYMAKRLKDHFDILYTAENGLVAHEFIIDCRPFDQGGPHDANIKIDDITKRLMDFGFHGPTMSWPVAGTLMIEPTESEPKDELDRFCDAMIKIREEIDAVRSGEFDATDNPLKHAPFTCAMVTGDDWSHGFTREQAAWPLPWVKDHKFWPTVARIDNAFGDRNLMCTCPSVEEMCEA